MHVSAAGLSERQLCIFVFLFRIINSFAIQSYFNPDEYWQSLEVAHFDVFGYGYKTWEWAPEWRVRSYAYPAIISAMYYVFKLLHIDHSSLLMYGPRVLHAIGTAITDIMVYRCANQWFGSNPANFALLCSLMNWFIFYALPRTFSNSFETYLTMIAFYFWPFPNAISSLILPQHAHKRRYALTCASIACIIRVTNAVIWIPLVLRELLILYHLKQYSLIKAFLLDLIMIASVSISVLIGIDSLYYGEFTVSPWQFYWFNNILNGSSLYGTHPFYWYFIIGIPAVIGTMTPSIFYALRFIGKLWGQYGQSKKNKTNHFALVSKLLPFVCCVWTVCVFSFNPHKEFRFLLPIVPILMVYCGVGLYDVFLSYKRVFVYVLVLLLTTNAFAGLFLAQFHQSAAIEVLKYLNKDIYKTVHGDKDNGYKEYGDIDVDFILSCHSTPLYSYLHLGSVDNHVELRFLECNPHFNEKDGRLTRSDTPSWWFEVNPSAYFKEKLTQTYQVHSCPKYLVISSHHLEFAKSVIDQCGYKERTRFIDNYLANKYLIVLSNIQTSVK
eukprot:104689_1